MPKVNLDDIKHKSHPYKVPKEYFEELNASILEQTNTTTPERVVRWFRQPAWQGILASFSVIMVLTLVFITRNTGEEQDLLAGVSDEEIMIYLADNELTEYEIIENFTFTDEDFLMEEDELLDGIEIEDETLQDLYLEYDVEDLSIQI